MAYRGITNGSAYWNALLSGSVTTYQIVYVELGNPAEEEIRLTSAYKNIAMPADYAFTFVNTLNWQVTGVDASAFYVVGKRLKFIDGSSVYYGTVQTVLFTGGNTAVQMNMEGGDSLTASITDVYRTQSGDLEGIYQAAGGLLSLAPFEETLQLTVNELELSLDGVTGVAVSDLLNFRYLDRTVKVWQGILDVNEVPIPDPVLLIDGRISGASISDDPERGVSKVSVKASSQWSDFKRKGGSRTNDRDHQRFYPGDLGFEYAAASKLHMNWGKDGKNNSTGGDRSTFIF